MSRYKCDHCGREFENPAIVTEPHGEKVGCCPYCHGWFEEVYECKICEHYYTDDEIESGVCHECLVGHAHIYNCIRYGDKHKEKADINEFALWYFGEEGINEILTRELKNALVPSEICYEFVENDLSSFAEFLIERKEN